MQQDRIQLPFGSDILDRFVNAHDAGEQVDKVGLASVVNQAHVNDVVALCGERVEHVVELA